MLSKSQARNFFLGATTAFSLVFLWLTVDTIRQVPARSNEDQLNDAVVRGKEIWDSNNCMGCHTILGEGAYYAPELTRAYVRRGEPWLRIFLRDPQAMFPGQRRMVQYDFTEDQISDVIAFLEWVGKIDTNGFPAAPDMTGQVAQAASLAPAAAVSSPGAGATTTAASSVPQIFSTVCVACHAVGGKGGNVGPALDGVSSRYTPEKLDLWLANPQAVKPNTAMPNLQLDDATRGELVRWLQTL